MMILNWASSSILPGNAFPRRKQASFVYFQLRDVSLKPEICKLEQSIEEKQKPQRI